jgi:hypothetical protein
MALTVRRLIGLLLEFDMTAEVKLEGCDCINPSLGVGTSDDGDIIIAADLPYGTSVDNLIT